MTEPKRVINPELLDQLLKDVPMGDMDSFAKMFQQLKKSLIERALDGELTHHLGYPKHAKVLQGNQRNGKYEKTIETEQSPVTIEVPRDRDASFSPQIVQKGQTRLKGFDEKIISMYARGMSMRDIQDHLEEIYGTIVSPELISNVTDSVLDEVKSWQTRPLETVYPLVYMDAIMIKIKDQGHIRNKALYMVIGVTLEGHKDILGLWIAQTEGAKFWLQILTDLKNRGVESIFIACVDGLTGFPDAIAATFPKTQVQLCIVHVIRNSLKYVSWKDRKEVAKDLKHIYTAANADAAETALTNFQSIWGHKYPTIAASWKAHWVHIIPFLSYPKDIRKAMYTTNSIESANRQIRKAIKTKGAFPNDDAAMKLVFLALQNARKKWTMPIRDWNLALNQFAILFHDSFPL